MAILPGTRLGPYEITSAIGAGGMGEVYRARDTRLNRNVALKVLPDVFAHDTERMARFEPKTETWTEFSVPNRESDIRRIEVDRANSNRIWWSGTMSNHMG
jgi:serine/threonine protein kinase